jgi:AcrR family transcriptional regulator
MMSPPLLSRRGNEPDADMTTVPAGPPVECGRRDRKKQATRGALRAAALKLVAARGFSQVTVEDIAEEADVSTRTFFNYFTSKESAVIGADPARVERMRESLLARPPDEPAITALRAVLVESAEVKAEEIDDLGEGKDAWFRRFSVVRKDPELAGAYSAHIAEIERNLVGAVAERLGTDAASDPFPALVTATALAATRVAGLYWSANGGTESLAELTGAAIDSVADGLLASEPRPQTDAPVAPAASRRRRSGGRIDEQGMVEQ